MAEAGARWLILAHQLPAHPSNLRVRVWRRLQQVGAVVLRNSLYVLPDTDEAREDFDWVREEIHASGGQVSVLEAAAVDGVTDAELIQQFRSLRTAEYQALAGEVRQAGLEWIKRKRQVSAAARERLQRRLRERYVAIQARDYFGAAGRPLVEQAFRDLEHAEGRPTAPPRAKKLRAADYRRRTWVTRPRPGIDRMACAWLIRRFIDRDARFMFAASPDGGKPKGLPYDMPDVEFGHHGAHCSFETFMERFGMDDPALVAISRIVHDLDLKESRFGMPESVAISRVVDGLRVSYADDARLLEQGMTVMEALYQSFASDSQPRRQRR